MTPADLDRLEALAHAATEGRWSLGYSADGVSYVNAGRRCICRCDHRSHKANAAFIAAANPSTVLRLIAMARKG